MARLLLPTFASIGAAISARAAVAPRWWLAVVGVVGIAAGIVTFLWPGITALILLFFIAAWSVAIGVVQWGGG